MNLLPVDPDQVSFAELFQNDVTWVPAIQHLAQKYSLSGRPVRGVRGSHIVYRVGNAWIKIMAPVFSKDMTFELAGLQTVKRNPKIATPQIIGTGILEGWFYVILTNVAGRRIGDIWNSLSAIEKNSLAKQIADATLEIQASIPNEDVNQRGNWNEFIEGQFLRIEENHRAKKLDPAWLIGLVSFMSKFEIKDFRTENPVFLHADLTWDHFLIEDSTHGPRLNGVIDFADCRLGHPEYDIPATACYIFKGQNAPLREYLSNLIRPAPDKNFCEKLMAWTCLHKYSDLTALFKNEMSQVPTGDFSALAKKVFPL